MLNALDRKYPTAHKKWGWEWVSPATSHYTDQVTGEKRRHHLHESVLQKAVKDTRLKAGIVSTTMVYTHILNRGGKGVRSPADGLAVPNR